MKRILIVEDSATMRLLLAASLEELATDARVDSAASGFEALRMLPAARYDLIVTDINMPDLNGLELISFVKRSADYCAIPIIVVSTEGSPRDRQKAFDLGASDYLSKPFEPDELLRCAERRLTQPAAPGSSARVRTG